MSLRHALLAALLAASVAACGATRAGYAPLRRSQVLVLGTIHDGHLASEAYGIDELRLIVRTVDPDYVLAEIPPDRLDTALAEFEGTGRVDEPRVRRFPEYVDAIFPLRRELGFGIVPCAAWTEALAEDRRAKLAAWQESRPEDYAAMEDGMAWIDDTLAAEGLADHPFGIHSERYDEIVATGLEPYDRLFNDALGAGGWTNVNRAHYALIEEALDRHRGEGRRFLVTFGAWHKHWFIERLRRRDDVVLMQLADFVAP